MILNPHKRFARRLRIVAIVVGMFLALDGACDLACTLGGMVCRW